jgi:hypothetical protein
VSAAVAKATHFLVSGPSNADSGIPFSLSVTALDSSNNPVTTYSETVHFKSTDLHAQLPPDSTLASGTAVFSATLAIPGSQTITGTDTVTAALSHFASNCLVQRATGKRTTPQQFKTPLMLPQQLGAARSYLKWLATLRPELYKCQPAWSYADQFKGRSMLPV